MKIGCRFDLTPTLKEQLILALELTRYQILSGLGVGQVDDKVSRHHEGFKLGRTVNGLLCLLIICLGDEWKGLGQRCYDRPMNWRMSMAIVAVVLLRLLLLVGVVGLMMV